MNLYSLYFRLLSNHYELAAEILTTFYNEVGSIEATNLSGFAAKVCPLNCLNADNLGDFGAEF